jgi:hypothetical protein
VKTFRTTITTRNGASHDIDSTFEDNRNIFECAAEVIQYAADLDGGYNDTIFMPTSEPMAKVDAADITSITFAPARVPGEGESASPNRT